MKRFFIAAVVFFTVILAGSSAFALVNVEGRYWFTSLDAKAKVSSGSVIGSDIDLVNSFGVDGKNNFFDGRIGFELGSHKIRYGFLPMKWDGTQVISQSVVFNGRTYSASTSVDAHLKIDYHRLGYEYDIIDALNNRLGVIFELKYFDTQSSLKASALGFDETKSLKAPVPTIGIAAQVGLPMLISLGGEVTGVTIGNKAYLFDGEAGLNIKPAPFITVSAGYRYFKLHLENNDDKGDFLLRGPYVMLKGNF